MNIIKEWTPLTRAKARVNRWNRILMERRHAGNFSTVGQIAVEIEPDQKMHDRLIAEAEAAVRDWEEVVRAVRAYVKSKRAKS